MQHPNNKAVEFTDC